MSATQWKLPFPTSAITSSFGVRVHPITKQRRMHNGTDWGRNGGTPIPAVAAGEVVDKGSNLASTGFGHWVKVKADDGMFYFAAHMVRPSHLARGQRVKLGTILGYVGRTGAATGDHLHLEVRESEMGGQVDPVAYIRAHQSAPSTPSQPSAGTYTVRRGDTLSGIAKRLGTTWQALYAANRSTIGSNPNRIFAGQVLRVAKSSKPAARKTYTVKSGDTLSGIAARLEVKGGWRKLHQLNRATIGSNPNRIKPGQVLRLP